VTQTRAQRSEVKNQGFAKLASYNYSTQPGGMRERLKRAVLKTAVPETVPGVRIPLPPPASLSRRGISLHYCKNRRKLPQFRRSCLQTAPEKVSRRSPWASFLALFSGGRTHSPVSATPSGECNAITGRWYGESVLTSSAFGNLFGLCEFRQEISTFLLRHYLARRIRYFSTEPSPPEAAVARAVGKVPWGVIPRSMACMLRCCPLASVLK
jgi:hypothetical protein